MVKSGKLEIALNQFAPTSTGFYLDHIVIHRGNKTRHEDDKPGVAPSVRG
jgi:hypothetical protein